MNDRYMDDHTTNSKPCISTASTTNVRNATFVYYAVTNAVNTNAIALVFAFRPRRVSTIGCSSPVGKFQPVCGTALFDTNATSDAVHRKACYLR